MNKVAINSKNFGKYLMNYPVIPFFIVYFLLAVFLIPGFFKVENLAAVFIQASFLVILACGMTFVFINGSIDFSVVGIMGLSGTAGAFIMKAGDSVGYVILAIAVMIGIGIGIGCFNGFSVTKLKMPSFIATMAAQMIFSGIALWYTNSETISDLPAAFTSISQTGALGIPMPIIIAAAIALISIFILNGSVFGRFLTAIGINQKASRISGVPVEKTIFSIFILSGLFASISAIMMTSQTGAAIPTLGNKMIMDIVAAVLIGGTSLGGGRGTIIGTVLGSFLVVILDNSLNLIGVEWFVINILMGVMILAVAALDILRIKKLN